MCVGIVAKKCPQNLSPDLSPWHRLETFAECIERCAYQLYIANWVLPFFASVCRIYKVRYCQKSEIRTSKQLKRSSYRHDSRQQQHITNPAKDLHTLQSPPPCSPSGMPMPRLLFNTGLEDVAMTQPAIQLLHLFHSTPCMLHMSAQRNETITSLGLQQSR